MFPPMLREEVQKEKEDMKAAARYQRELHVMYPTLEGASITTLEEIRRLQKEHANDPMIELCVLDECSEELKILPEGKGLELRQKKFTTGKRVSSWFPECTSLLITDEDVEWNKPAEFVEQLVSIPMELPIMPDEASGKASPNATSDITSVWDGEENWNKSTETSPEPGPQTRARMKLAVPDPYLNECTNCGFDARLQDLSRLPDPKGTYENQCQVCARFYMTPINTAIPLRKK